MRKDVGKLPDFFSWSSGEPARDLDQLRWPNAPDLATRYGTMLSQIDFGLYSPQRRLRLLDLGCGLGLLLDWLSANGLLDRVDYTGVDLVSPILGEVRRRWPDQNFVQRDVRDQPFAADSFDYCVICGIFTLRNGNSYDDTVALAQSTMKAVWPSVTLGLAFNSMSKHVDWERDDLLHWPLDDIMAFCKRDLSRHVSFRLDYGLWETSTFVRKLPLIPASTVPGRW